MVFNEVLENVRLLSEDKWCCLLLVAVWPPQRVQSGHGLKIQIHSLATLVLHERVGCKRPNVPSHPLESANEQVQVFLLVTEQRVETWEAERDSL